MKNTLKNQLIKLGENDPSLRGNLRPIITYLTKTAASCPTITKNYGGLPSNGGFGSYKEYEIGAGRISEAVHCILGSVGRLYIRDENDEWVFNPEKMKYGEASHIEEETGIIEKAVQEYQRDVYLHQLYRSIMDGPQRAKYVHKMIDDIKEQAPKLGNIAKTMKGSVQPDQHPSPLVLEVIYDCYDVVIALTKDLMKSMTVLEKVIDEGKIDQIVDSVPNAYSLLDKSGKVKSLRQSVSALKKATK